MGNDDNDILGKFTKFVDRNLRAVRAVSWLLAGAGIIIIVRRTYVFRWFQTVSDVPAEFITKNITLHGHVKEVRKDNSLGALHIPLLRWFNNSYHKVASEPLSQCSLLAVSVLGVEFREGSHKWLCDHVLSSKLHMTPVRVTKENTIDCLLYKKKSWLSTICINEEMVHQGVAVTCHLSGLVDNPVYTKLLRKLLKAELKAEKKGHGIWVKPSLSEKLQLTLSSCGNKIKVKLSTIGNIFKQPFKWRENSNEEP